MAKSKLSKKSPRKTKAKAKSTRKRFPPVTPPETMVKPENLIIREDDGVRTVFVRPNFAGVACVYNPQEMKEAMAGLIFRFLELKRTGKEMDITVLSAGAGSRIGRAEVHYGDEDPQEALVKYSQMAADYFTEHLVRALSDLPELLSMQVFNATIARMKEDGFLSFKEGSGVTKLWDSYNKAMAVKVKRDWKAPKRGKVGYWNEQKRAEALEIYNSVHEPLARAYPHRTTKEGEKEWIRLIMELGGYDRAGAMSRKTINPSTHAFTIAGTRLGVMDEYSRAGDAYFEYQLSIARAEKRSREGAPEVPPISSDINDLSS